MKMMILSNSNNQPNLITMKVTTSTNYHLAFESEDESKNATRLNLNDGLSISFNLGKIRGYGVSLAFPNNGKPHMKVGCREISLDNVRTALSNLKGEKAIQDVECLRNIKTKQLSQAIIVDEGQHYFISKSGRAYKKDEYTKETVARDFSYLKPYKINSRWSSPEEGFKTPGGDMLNENTSKYIDQLSQVLFIVDQVSEYKALLAKNK